MATKMREIEGTWEEIAARGAEFAGHRVRLIVLSNEEEQEVPAEAAPLSERNRRMLRTLEKWQQTPLTEEEIAILEDFERFRKEHPFSLRRGKKR